MLLPILLLLPSFIVILYWLSPVLLFAIGVRKKTIVLGSNAYNFYLDNSEAVEEFFREL